MNNQRTSGQLPLRRRRWRCCRLVACHQQRWPTLTFRHNAPDTFHLPRLWLAPLQSKGGGNTWENLVACCTDCNGRKGDKSLERLGWRLRKQPKARCLPAAGVDGWVAGREAVMMRAWGRAVLPVQQGERLPPPSRRRSSCTRWRPLPMLQPGCR